MGSGRGMDRKEWRGGRTRVLRKRTVKGNANLGISLRCRWSVMMARSEARRFAGERIVKK